MGGHSTYHVNVIKYEMRDYMDMEVTPPKWVTSPTWGPLGLISTISHVRSLTEPRGPPPPCKQALSLYINKSCVHDMFSECPLNTDTQIIRTLWHVPAWCPYFNPAVLHPESSGFLVTRAPGWVLGISSDGDDQRIFWGLKFLIPGFFGLQKFGKYFFG